MHAADIEPSAQISSIKEEQQYGADQMSRINTVSIQAQISKLTFEKNQNHARCLVVNGAIDILLELLSAIFRDKYFS